MNETKELLYHFTPAALLSNFTPLVVILDEDDPIEPLNFEYKMWNILTPINYSDKEESLVKLIEQLSDEYECDEHIYLYATPSAKIDIMKISYLCKANALYINTPLTLSKNSSYPIVYLDDGVKIGRDRDATTLNFISLCKEMGITLRLEHSEERAESQKSKIIKALTLLEKMSSQA